MLQRCKDYILYLAVTYFQEQFIFQMLSKSVNKEEQIKGWAHEDEANSDTLILTSILNRNTSKKILPQIHNRAKTIGQMATEESNSNELLQKKQLESPVMSTRHKTQLLNQFLPKSLAKKHIQLMQQIGQIQLSPYILNLKILESQFQQSLKQKEQELSKSRSYQIKLKKINNSLHKPYSFKKSNPPKSQLRNKQSQQFQTDFIQKSHSKLFAKLNKLKKMHNSIFESHQQYQQKIFISKIQQQSSNKKDLYQQQKRKQKKHGILKFVKIQKRPQQLLVKQYIQSKTSKKAQNSPKAEINGQFNDDVIFSRNFSVFNTDLNKNISNSQDFENLKYSNRFKLAKK